MSAQIMAIVNTSPESFAGDGIAVSDHVALRARLQTAIAQGADILDIGGQSTRPGANIITEQTEIGRVVPAIRLALELSGNIPISIDTFKPGVARAAFAAGATILNDVTGLADDRMVQFAAQADCDVVVMHMRGTPSTMTRLTDYPLGVVAELKAYFRERTAALITSGVQADHIIIDPGIGFAKTAAQSFELTRRLSELRDLGFRVLYGASNKSFIGKAVGSERAPAPVAERAVGTAVLQAFALQNGADVIRVHDVEAAIQTRNVVEALAGRLEDPS